MLSAGCFKFVLKKKSFLRRYIRYLQRFSLLGDLPVQDYKLSYDQELVQVDANEEGLKSILGTCGQRHREKDARERA